MPTQVPNSGYVEKVYFNTELSVEEVVSLISGLIYYTLENQPITYSILASSDWLHTLNITNENGNYTILKYNRETNDLTIIWTNYEYSGDNLSGWREVAKNAISFECEVTNTGGTFDVGAENDKLTNLISTTPFEETIALKPFLKGIADAIREKKKTTELINAQNFRNEILSIQGGGGLIEVTELPEVGEEDVVYKLLGSAEGTTVPSGKLTNIYFNNNLTTEEVVSIIESANLGYSTDGLIPNSYLIAQCLMIIKNENTYGIMYIHSDGEGSADFNNIEAIFSSANAEGVDFVGWNPNFKNPIVYEYNNDIESNDTAISKNEALKDLVSSTPYEASAEYFIYEKLPPLAVPTSGTISKVYINPIYTAEEMRAIIEKYATVPLQGLQGYPIAFDTNTSSVLAMLYNDSGFYVIGVLTYDGSSFTLDQNKLLYNTSITDGTPVFNTEGLSLNWTTISNVDGMPIGSKNSEISNLISITPDFSVTGQFKQISGGFKEVEELPNVGNSNYTYILKKDNYEVYAKSEELGIFNFIEYMRQNGASSELVGVFDSKDQLPTSNIKISDGMSSLYFYYVKNDDLYIYGSFSAEGNVWTGLSDLMFPFGGEITSTSEITATETLYVLKSEGIEKYYRYTYIFELNMYQVDNGNKINFTEIAKEQGLKVNAEAVTSLPSEPIESDLSTTFYVYYLKGDNAYVYNQNILGGWGTVSTLFEIPYNGEVSSLDEMTTDGLYVLYNDGYSYKELSKIPEGYIMPSGTLDITNNGNMNVTNYAYVNVNVSAQAVLQQKTIDPIKSSQDITPDSGYDGLSKVTIRAIPDNYIIPSGTITVDSYSGPVSFDVTNYKELDLNLSLYENEVELLGNKLTCISNKADEYTYIKIITYDAQTDIYYDMFFDIKDAGTIIKTIQDDLEIRLISQSTHNSLKVGSSSGGSEYAVLTKNGSNNKFSMNVSEDITIYLTYE